MCIKWEQNYGRKLMFLLGTYCPAGSARPLACPAGQYCGTYALALPSGDCHAGFFCNGSATLPNTIPCLAGHYCVQGTLSEELCPRGSFASEF